MINSILQGDCLDIMQEIPAKSIDMILADLPYGTTAASWDTIIPFAPLWRCYERIIKDDGPIVLTAAEHFASQLINSNLKLFKYDLIWFKTNPKGHLNAKKMPLRSHEQILIFNKKPPVYNPQKTTGHYRKISKSVYSRANDGSKVNGAENRDTLYDSTERNPTSVFSFSYGDHSK